MISIAGNGLQLPEGRDFENEFVNLVKIKIWKRKHH